MNDFFDIDVQLSKYVQDTTKFKAKSLQITNIELKK